MHIAYNHDPIPNANIHSDTGHIDVQLHFRGNNIVHGICYMIDSANRTDYNDILKKKNEN